MPNSLRGGNGDCFCGVFSASSNVICSLRRYTNLSYWVYNMICSLCITSRRPSLRLLRPGRPRALLSLPASLRLALAAVSASR